MRSETGLWEYIKPKLAKFGDFARIETGASALGIPDVDVYHNLYGAMKIELKFCKNTSKGFTLRPAQYAFITRRCRLGDKATFVLACLNDVNHTVKPEFMIIPNCHAKELVQDHRPDAWRDLAIWLHRGRLNENLLKEMFKEMEQYKNGK
jgi:hypothetical protein